MAETLSRLLAKDRSFIDLSLNHCPTGLNTQPQLPQYQSALPLDISADEVSKGITAILQQPPDVQQEMVKYNKFGG